MAMLGVDKAADSSVFTEESFLQHGPEVNQGFASMWIEVMPAETPPPDMASFLKFLALGLGTSRGEMVGTAQAHETKLGANSVIRVKRDECQSDLIERYIDTRTIYEIIYGREKAMAMGFSFPRKDVPSRFGRQASMVINNFKALPPGEPIVGTKKGKEQMALKPEDVIDVLELPYNQLSESLRRLVTGIRESQTTQKLKEDCYNKQIKRYSMHAKCGEMIYRMVGLDKFADQIKPSIRRPGLRAVTEPEDDAPAQSLDSDTPSREIIPAAESVTSVIT